MNFFTKRTNKISSEGIERRKLIIDLKNVIKWLTKAHKILIRLYDSNSKMLTKSEQICLDTASNLLEDVKYRTYGFYSYLANRRPESQLTKDDKYELKLLSELQKDIEYIVSLNIFKFSQLRGDGRRRSTVLLPMGIEKLESNVDKLLIIKN